MNHSKMDEPGDDQSGGLGPGDDPGDPDAQELSE